MNLQRFRIFDNVPLRIEILRIKRYEFKEQVLTSHQAHASFVMTVLIRYKTFRSQIGFNIRNRLTQQFFTSHFIWFERNATMNKKTKVGPDLVNIIQFIPFDDFLYTYLYPGRNPYYKSDIPSRCLLYNLFELTCPVPCFCNFFPWFIKGAEPERYFFGGNSAEIAFIISGSLLKIRTT